MAERRFNEQEVSFIFERAAEAQHTARRQLTSGEGMSLQELKDIGKEAGIAPEMVEQAAKSIDQVGRATSRSFFGLPIGVGRTVELERRLTEDEWDQLVVDLRETFDARGRLRQDGSFRQWTNGNLQALLEPTPKGHRLRLRTFKGDAASSIVGGLALFGASSIGLISSMMRGGDAGGLTSLALIAAMGLTLFGAGALRLPGWARLRKRQMEEVAARLSSSVSTDPRP